MTPETQVSLALIFLVLTFILNLTAIVISYKNRNDTKAEKREGNVEEDVREKVESEKNFLKLNLKLDNFGGELKTLARNTDKTSDVLNQIQQHIIVVDSQIDNHDRILEEHNQRLGNLEEKVNG